MDTSFYAAARGAMSYQDRLNIISNNIANVSTPGYKAKTPAFLDLMHYNMHAPAETDTKIRAGTGAIVQRTDINLDEAGIALTEGAFDFAIVGEGFFQLRNPVTDEISYTRNGCFSASLRGNEFYLVSDGGNLVLDAAGNPIRIGEGDVEADPGIYTFASFNGMQSTGDNEFTPVQKNGNPIAATGSTLRRDCLEQSNVDFSNEMTKTIEASRAYSYVLKMIQTSDEVEQTINSLRG